MRVQGLDSNGHKLVKSQFYVVLSDEEPNDGQFSYVFGYVIEGCEVCEVISKMDPSEKIVVGDLGVLPWNLAQMEYILITILVFIIMCIKPLSMFALFFES